MGSIGPLELVIVLVVILLIFGPKRLPGLGRQLGSGLKDFKDAISGASKQDDEEERVARLPAAEPAKTTVTPAAEHERERREADPPRRAG